MRKPTAAKLANRLLRDALAALGAMLASAAIAPLHAQDYPTRPVRIIVPFSAGGAVDGPIRVIAQDLTKRLGQQFVIENRPGAGATLGSEAVAKAAPNGYTLLLASQTNAIAASLYARLSFNPIEDFTPISLLGREPGVLVAHPSLPVATVRELIALAKEQPGKIDYGSSGNGSGQHLFAAMFTSMAGISMTHVPYRGSAQATVDLLAGQIMVAIPGIAGMLGHIRAGKLRALAVTGVQRSPQLPLVPTLDEAGVKGYSAYVWMGVLAPKGTPEAIIGKLHREFVAALAAPEVGSYLSGASLEVIGSTPAEFDVYFRAERDRWAKIVKETGAKVD